MRNEEMGVFQGDVYYDVDKRKVYLSGDFNEKNAREVSLALQEMEADDPRDPINLFITSDGGEIESFLAIYDTIQTLKCLVNTIALGKCYSAGAYLLLSGTGQRLAYKNAFIMIHEMRDCTGGSYTDMKIYQLFNDKVQERLNTIVAKHTGQSLEKIESDLKRDIWMFAEDAVEYGIIDGIITEASE
jgi:ATP-dependent Clp protease protease subunit